MLGNRGTPYLFPALHRWSARSFQLQWPVKEPFQTLDEHRRAERATCPLVTPKQLGRCPVRRPGTRGSGAPSSTPCAPRANTSRAATSPPGRHLPQNQVLQHPGVTPIRPRPVLRACPTSHQSVAEGLSGPTCSPETSPRHHGFRWRSFPARIHRRYRPRSFLPGSHCFRNRHPLPACSPPTKPSTP